MGRRCHAPGCPIQLHRDRVFCARHFFMVPLPVRRRLMAMLDEALYAIGQQETGEQGAEEGAAL